MVSYCSNFLLLVCACAIRVRKNQDSHQAKYVPYKNLPQYSPDHYKLFDNCTANPKIAILIAGRASSMVHPEKTASFRKHVSDYLQQMGARGLTEGSPPDVFVHVKTGEGKVVPSRESSLSPHSVVSREMCEVAVKEMGATSHVIEDGWGKTELKRPDCFVTKKQGKDPHHPQGEAGYWHSIEGVFSLMTAHEQKTFDNYEIVIFQRPDKSWKRDVDYAKKPIQTELELSGQPANFYNENSQSVSCTHGHIWGDQLMILPRSASYPFETLYTDLALSANPRICGIDRNEDIFWRTQKELAAKGFPVEWTMALRAP